MVKHIKGVEVWNGLSSQVFIRTERHLTSAVGASWLTRGEDGEGRANKAAWKHKKPGYRRASQLNRNIHFLFDKSGLAGYRCRIWQSRGGEAWTWWGGKASAAARESPPDATGNLSCMPSCTHKHMSRLNSHFLPHAVISSLLFTLLLPFLIILLLCWFGLSNSLLLGWIHSHTIQSLHSSTQIFIQTGHKGAEDTQHPLSFAVLSFWTVSRWRGLRSLIASEVMKL